MRDQNSHLDGRSIGIKLPQAYCGTRTDNIARNVKYATCINCQAAYRADEAAQRSPK